ncbi:hypothetical protein H4R18_004735, partial [Coemansia javaensis]
MRAQDLPSSDDLTDWVGKSNQEYLGRLVMPWFQARTKPPAIRWVRAHAGDPQNEKADRAAKAAHSLVDSWTLQLGWEPTARKYWLHAGDAIAPLQAGP